MEAGVGGRLFSGRCARVAGLLGAVVAVVALASVGAEASGAHVQRVGRGERPALTVAGETSGELSAVACVAASNCWAVGYRNQSGAELNAALHWNGKKWTAVNVPDPAGTASQHQNDLNGVTCVSGSDCWAVGEESRGYSGPSVGEALHWNGKVWSSVKVPNRGGRAAQDGLFGVTCSARSYCFAVGYSSTSDGAPLRNAVLRWNGKKWSSVKAPDPGGKRGSDANELFGVACPSKSDCWAVGDGAGANHNSNQALRWNGKKWSSVKVPQPGGKGSADLDALFGVACVSRSDCLAVGDSAHRRTAHSNGPNLNEAFHWNGKRWSATKVPNPGKTGAGAFNGFSSVACTVKSHCWAAGDTQASAVAPVLNEAQRWNGKRWSAVKVPDPAPGNLNQLTGVACVSAADCWTVGDWASGSGPILAEVLHWNGKRWSVG